MTTKKTTAPEMVEQLQSEIVLEKVNRELVFHSEHFWTSQETNLISEAMVKFHALNLSVSKEGTANITSQVSRKYIRLDDIMNVVRPAMASVDCYVEQHLAGDSVLTRVVHMSGQFIASKFYYQTWEGGQVNNLQKFGGGLTYLKRYGICAILNIVADDDNDGNDNNNVGYNEPTKVDDGKEWLNLTFKNGSPNPKGETAKKFVQEGGAVADIIKKYKVSKVDLAILNEIERSVERTEPREDIY